LSWTQSSITHQSSLFSILSLLFFFLTVRPPRDLHSFPTRRSSDLAGVIATMPQTAPEIPPSTVGLPWRIHSIANQPSVAAAAARSEEHTSELQSRGHLVCRLLLEKKKKKTYKN